MPSPLLAQAGAPPKDEHFFIFIELLGGVHHLISTDYPDPGVIKGIEGKYPQAVMRFKLEEDSGFSADDSNEYKLSKEGITESPPGGVIRSTDKDVYRANGYSRLPHVFR